MRALKSYLLVFIVSIVWIDSSAQKEIQKDTTYTVWSTYQKLKKQYPEIKVVNPIPLLRISQRMDVPYITIDQGGT